MGGELRDHFSGVGAKHLSAVDAEPSSSNQHEIGVTADMRRFVFGEQERRFEVRYVWLGQDDDGFAAVGHATYYDARANNPNRPAEYRLYYPANPVTEAMGAGDALFLAMHNDGELYFVVAPRGSNSEQQLSWLFGVRPSNLFDARRVEAVGPTLGFAGRFILEDLGIEIAESDGDRLDGIVEQFGTEFPTTAAFSGIARNTVPDEVDPHEDPDGALLAWLDHEEALFRRLERKVVAERLEAGFVTDEGVDVDGFVSFSLTVHNRRKSRMGHSLEHHAAAVFRERRLKFDRHAVTENNNKPDFLFPGIEAYRAAPSGNWRLAMLGAKSTCKDRWRQVLVEAEKIPEKHLLTLEPGISESQTCQMGKAKLQLVVPAAIHASFTRSQQGWLWTFDRFIREVEARQRP